MGASDDEGRPDLWRQRAGGGNYPVVTAVTSRLESRRK
jgi:hypothetical protein